MLMDRCSMSGGTARQAGDCITDQLKTTKRPPQQRGLQAEPRTNDCPGFLLGSTSWLAIAVGTTLVSMA